MALTESQNSEPCGVAAARGPDREPRPAARLAEGLRRPLDRAADRRRGLPDPRVQRRPDLPVADPARALDGQLRVRHLRLCLDAGAGDRRSGRSRPRHVGAALRAGIHQARRVRPAARLPVAAAAGSRSAARPSSPRPASRRSSCSSRISPATSCCRSRSPARRCRSTALMQMQDGIARSLQLDPRGAAAGLCGAPPHHAGASCRRPICSNFPANAETAVIAVAVALDADRDRPDHRAQPQARARRPARAEGLRGQDLALGFAADPDRRGLLSPAHQHRHRPAAAFPHARRRRRLLRRGQDPGADRLRSFRRVGGGGPPLQRVSRHQGPRPARRNPRPTRSAGRSGRRSRRPW